MNFQEVYEDFKIYAQKRHKKQGFVTLISNFNSNILPYFKDKNIEDITKLDILDWQNKIYSLGFRYTYSSKLYLHFRAFFQFCCDFYNLESNPFDNVKNFNRDYQETKKDFYNLEEFNFFIKNVDNNIYKQFFNLMFFTGTRPGETFALQFSDLQGDYISITKNMTTKGGRTIDTPKNRSSIRLIRIDNKLKKDLLNLKEYYIKKYGMSDYDYFIFGGIKPIAVSTITRYKNEVCARINLRPITLHEFRHSHATLLLQSGIMINEVSRRLGHSNTSTTLNIYCHTDLAQEKRVLNTLNSIRNNLFVTLISNFKKLFHL